MTSLPIIEYMLYNNILNGLKILFFTILSCISCLLMMEDSVKLGYGLWRTKSIINANQNYHCDVYDTLIGISWILIQTQKKRENIFCTMKEL